METAREIAKRYRVTPETVRRMADSGQIPCIRMGGPRGHYRFDPGAVQAALEQQNTATALAQSALERFSA